MFIFPVTAFAGTGFGFRSLKIRICTNRKIDASLIDHHNDGTYGDFLKCVCPVLLDGILPSVWNAPDSESCIFLFKAAVGLNLGAGSVGCLSSVRLPAQGFVTAFALRGRSALASTSTRQE